MSNNIIQIIYFLSVTIIAIICSACIPYICDHLLLHLQKKIQQKNLTVFDKSSKIR